MTQFSVLRSHFPNILTLSRIVLSFIFVFFIYHNYLFQAFVVFVIASITDFFDGFLARKWGVESDLGKLLDPLADKMLMFFSYVVFAYLHYIPIYVSIIVIVRDLIILLVIISCRFLGISLDINPILSSKINTAVQLMYIAIVLASRILEVNTLPLFDICSNIVCVSTIFSMVDYMRKYYWIKNEICKYK
jgi:cardiolipin synthase